MTSTFSVLHVHLFMIFVISCAFPRSNTVQLKVGYELQWLLIVCRIPGGIWVRVVLCGRRGGGKVGQLFTCNGMPSLLTDRIYRCISLHRAVSLQQFLQPYLIPSQLSTMVYLYVCTWHCCSSPSCLKTSKTWPYDLDK